MRSLGLVDEQGEERGAYTLSYIKNKRLYLAVPGYPVQVYYSSAFGPPRVEPNLLGTYYPTYCRLIL